MRFPAQKIKDAILDPRRNVRDRATTYFAESYTRDVSIMSQVIKAVETYDKADAFHLVGSAKDLPQTEESIAWVIDELNDEQSNRYPHYSSSLSEILLEADPALLLPREAAILEARHFSADRRSPLIERLKMASWDETTCWREVARYCDEAATKPDRAGVDWEHAHRIAEALARHGAGIEERVHALLGQKADHLRNGPGPWRESLLVTAAGLARLESTVPLLVEKLRDDMSEFVHEECSEALTRIGTPAVILEVGEAYPRAEDHFRIFACNPLEHIPSDLAVDTCLRLLAGERNETIRAALASALLCQFAHEGIDVARSQLLGGELDFEREGLRVLLLETCTLTGERFPEYDKWLAETEADKEEHRGMFEKLEGDPLGLLNFMMGKLVGKKAAESSPIKPPAPPMVRPPSHFPIARKRKVGRNEPCPCGSGKKFKVCCGRN